MLFNLIIAIILNINFLDAVFDDRPIVTTKVGVIRGVRASDGEYDMFMGIPYARVNMTNPYGDSLPYPPFNGIFEANNDSAQCIQIHDRHGLGGSLNCLQLNIYIPNNIPQKDLPVIVYIFGGSLRQGSFSKKYYGPRFLMRYGIILVIMNYRVCSYGTLCLEIPEAPGNQFLKDQHTALKWIQRNIREFGGNPNKITLMGHSGGAVSVNLHVLYAKEKLFHQAIIASGSAFYPLVESNPSNELILNLSKHLGFETEDIKEAHGFVSTVEPSKVIQVEHKLGYKMQACLETKFESVNNFMTEPPKEVVINNNNVIPLLIGNSGDEAYYLFHNYDQKYFEENEMIYNIMKTVFNSSHEDFPAAYQLVTEHYKDDHENKLTKRKFIDFFSDFNYVYPNKVFIEKYLKIGAKIYYYLFSYCGGRNFLKNQRNLTNTLPTHGDELGYIFDISFPYMDKDTEEDYILLDNFLTMLTNFAKYGDPTPEPTQLLPKWKQITNDTWYYLNIDKELSLHEDPFNRQAPFWDNFYKMFGHLVIH